MIMTRVIVLYLCSLRDFHACRDVMASVYSAGIDTHSCALVLDYLDPGVVDQRGRSSLDDHDCLVVLLQFV